MKLYSISNWKELFETSETRKLVSLQWWAKPNKHDGLGFRRLAQQRDRVELFCAWNLIGDVASRSTRDQRGILIRNGKALNSEDLSLMTGFPQSIFDKALDFFSRKDVGWLTAIEWNENAPNDPAAPSREEGAPDGQAASPDALAESPGTPGESPGRMEGREGREDREGKEGRGAHSLAHIPSEREFLDAFMNDAIPTDYLREKWIWFNESRAWLNGYGRLVDWAAKIRRWWAADRAKWQPDKPQRNAI